MEDMKAVMNPYTAVKLKVKKSNSVKDFVSVSGSI
jgi:hypothetical protein